MNSNYFTAKKCADEKFFRNFFKNGWPTDSESKLYLTVWTNESEKKIFEHLYTRTKVVKEVETH